MNAVSSSSALQGPVQRLAALRQAMQKQGIDAWIIPSADPHLSEYLPEHWQGRRWVSGFTGSVGTLVVTALVLLAVGAGLWFWVLKPASHGTAAPTGMPPPPGAGGPGGHGGMSPVTVSVVSAEQGAFPVVIRAVGNVTPYNTVTVVPQVEGRLLRVHFPEGAPVAAIAAATQYLDL